MYVWQMNDGLWRISLEARQRGKYTEILKNREAYDLFEEIYFYRHHAEAAERTIRALLA